MDHSHLLLLVNSFPCLLLHPTHVAKKLSGPGTRSVRERESIITLEMERKRVEREKKRGKREVVKLERAGEKKIQKERES